MNKTQIFASYAEFLARADKSINGVSPEFARAFDYTHEQDNATNKGCWNCFECIGCTDCIDCINSVELIGCIDCHSCNSCIDCIDCKNCDSCDGEQGASGCDYGFIDA